MRDSEIEAIIATADALPPPELIDMDRLGPYRGGGMFHSWNAKAADGANYIVKFASHEQPPHHRLIAELATARFALLLGQGIAPAHALVRVLDGHVDGIMCGGCTIPLSAGVAFGSREVSDSFQIKGAPIPTSIPARQVAGIVVLQTWLEGSDVHVLHTAEGDGYSIDHAGFLPTAATWDANGRPEPIVSLPPWPGLEHDPRLASRVPFALALDGVLRASDEEIVSAFGGVPSGWWGTVADRVVLAAFALARRSRVEQCLSPLWAAGAGS